MAEQRLIDADELQKKFRIECAGECAICKNNNDFESCKLIDSAPIIDAIPIVLCKDCKYSRPADKTNPREMLWKDGTYICGNRFGLGDQCNLGEKGVSPNAYCSYGERKDGNNK